MKIQLGIHKSCLKLGRFRHSLPPQPCQIGSYRITPGGRWILGKRKPYLVSSPAQGRMLRALGPDEWEERY